MTSNLIFKKQRYSGRRRSYISPTWQCWIAFSTTLIRSLCYQGFSFALATPGGTSSVKVVGEGSLGPRAPVSPFCFAGPRPRRGLPGYGCTSANPASQWFPTGTTPRSRLNHTAVTNLSACYIVRAGLRRLSLFSAQPAAWRGGATASARAGVNYLHIMWHGTWRLTAFWAYIANHIITDSPVASALKHATERMP